MSLAVGNNGFTSNARECSENADESRRVGNQDLIDVVTWYSEVLRSSERPCFLRADEAKMRAGYQTLSLAHTKGNPGLAAAKGSIPSSSTAY